MLLLLAARDKRPSLEPVDFEMSENNTQLVPSSRRPPRTYDGAMWFQSHRHLANRTLKGAQTKRGTCPDLMMAALRAHLAGRQQHISGQQAARPTAEQAQKYATWHSLQCHFARNLHIHDGSTTCIQITRRPNPRSQDTETSLKNPCIDEIATS